MTEREEIKESTMTRNWTATWGMVALLAIAGGGISMGQGQAGSAPAEITTDSGLKYVDLVVGTGREAAAGDQATVHYTGWLTDGKKFDSSVDRREPFSFPLGSGRVIRGWDEGVVGMKVGGKRKLTIPPQLGYGSRGAGGVIPPNATLVFDVELLEVR
jgi:FKBP-type peptidyl-prolyl cis-trans isomerase